MSKQVKTYIGLDNGGTGSLGILKPDGEVIFMPVPTRLERDWMKRKQNITRIIHKEFKELLKKNIPSKKNSFLLFERPLKNPAKMEATMSAHRAFENALIAVEDLGIEYDVVDSRLWQGELLPDGLKGPELKQASFDIGMNMFPQVGGAIIQMNDADGILIAEYCRRHY